MWQIDLRIHDGLCYIKSNIPAVYQNVEVIEKVN